VRASPTRQRRARLRAQPQIGQRYEPAANRRFGFATGDVTSQVNHSRVEPRINPSSPQAIIARKQPRKAGAPRRQALGPSLSPSTLATAQAQSEQPYNVLLAPLQPRNPIFRNPSRPRARPAGPPAIAGSSRRRRQRRPLRRAAGAPSAARAGAAPTRNLRPQTCRNGS